MHAADTQGGQEQGRGASTSVLLAALVALRKMTEVLAAELDSHARTASSLQGDRTSAETFENFIRMMQHTGDAFRAAHGKDTAVPESCEAFARQRRDFQ